MAISEIVSSKDTIADHQGKWMISVAKGDPMSRISSCDNLANDLDLSRSSRLILRYGDQMILEQTVF